MHSIIEIIKGILGPLIMISSFIYFCHLGISEEWSLWFLKAIGLEILMIILIFLIYFLGTDFLGDFYFTDLLQKIGIMAFLTILLSFAIGLNSLWIPPILTILFIYFPDVSRSRDREDDY